MRKLDIFIVRFIPIVLFLIIAIDIIYCWNGINNLAFNHLHYNSFIYALALFLISLSNPKYHCVWNRAMYVELMLVPLINYADAKWCIFPDAVPMLITLSATWIIAALVTVILALRHFIKPRLKKICQQVKNQE